MGSVTNMDEYRPFAPEGTIEFAPDVKTGFEQIDLHMSDKPSVERLRALAVAVAESGHAVDPTDVDPSRVEFGGNVLDFTARQELHARQAETVSTAEYLKAHGARIVAYRTQAIEQSGQRAA